MNTKLLLIYILIATISSCTTVYKSGQTPDDVYYSPVIPQNDYVSVNKEEETYTNNSAEEDREIRRRINNRRLRVYDDYDYNYPYAYNYPYPYNQYSYNPYYSYYSYACSCYPPVYGYPVIGKSTSTYTAPRKFNLGAYGNTATNNIYLPNAKGNPGIGTVPVRTFSTSTTTKSPGVGNFVRKLLTTPSNSNSNVNDNSIQTRTYQPVRTTPVNTVTNTPSSTSNSNSGNVPVRTFHK